MEISLEQDLWQSCLKGDKAAFKELYCRHYASLYFYGLKLVNNKEVVEDAIQDLFVKLMRGYKSLSPTVNPKGYLLKALRNTLLNTMEKERAMEDVEAYEEAFAIEPDEGPTDEAASETKVLMKAYSELPARQKEIVYLYYVKELKHEEIAEVLDINYQSSKNLLARSLVKLRQIYFKKIHFLSKQ